jgi:hypothetical protein
VDGNTLTIQLARDATIMPDDALMPTANHGVLIDAIDASAQFTATAPGVIVTKCDSCTPPTVIIVGPKVSVPLHLAYLVVRMPPTVHWVVAAAKVLSASMHAS